MKRTAAILLSATVSVLPAFAVGDVDQNYIRSLAAPGKTVLVIEYYGGEGKVTERKGYASATGFKAVSPTDFAVDDKTVLHLYGLEPCEGEVVNRSEDFAGSCADFAQRQLAIMLQSPKVIFCRAFVSEQNARSRTQHATATITIPAASTRSTCSRSNCSPSARSGSPANRTGRPCVLTSSRPRRLAGAASACGPTRGSRDNESRQSGLRRNLAGREPG